MKRDSDGSGEIIEFETRSDVLEFLRWHESRTVGNDEPLMAANTSYWLVSNDELYESALRSITCLFTRTELDMIAKLFPKISECIFWRDFWITISKEYDNALRE